MSDAYIVELETLRRQLQQLHELFAVVIEETRPTPDNPNVMPWPELLSKFNVLAGKYAILSQAVGQKHAALLKEMTVVPRTQPNGIHEQNILSVLLRTKLAPEIEKEEEEIWAQVETEAQQDKRHELLAITAMTTFTSLRKSHNDRVQNILRDSQGRTAAAQQKQQHDQQEQESDIKTEVNTKAFAEPVSLEDILAFASSGVAI
ncbi:hypothetical protein COEREDRAFT_85201 [Coemansia reversa NRRL 1564]|uniref:Mediator of RNA polymerase II transcription subunit 8 n=1 Tax=Coemansia reversa (strain ATCC 12441 / NRRL 1564) TaxID=763665 RepID=A0A2G5BIA2_COERN|nr:hypothetical protein COEREDRAFT_85201 [Coemansia reversa NRRL 1564]|eukprot:PIA18748.1 hypothetical protein COEREDRAFT_85201 [Coemansia reversa NRRL 1564]